MYLVDANVISAAAPSGPASFEIVAWMDAHSALLFLSSVTITEIEDASPGCDERERRAKAGI